MADYLQTVSEVMLNVLQDGLGEAFGIRTFYDGDPGVFPRDQLPAICVIKTKADIDQDSTQRDTMDSTYMIKVIFNSHDDWSDSTQTEYAQKQLERMVEGRDYSTGYYVPESVMGTLRQKFTMGNRIVGNKARITYGISERPDKRYYAEAHVEISVREKIIMSGART